MPWLDFCVLLACAFLTFWLVSLQLTRHTLLCYPSRATGDEHNFNGSHTFSSLGEINSLCAELMNVAEEVIHAKTLWLTQLQVSSVTLWVKHSTQVFTIPSEWESNDRFTSQSVFQWSLMLLLFLVACNIIRRTIYCILYQCNLGIGLIFVCP